MNKQNPDFEFVGKSLKIVASVIYLGYKIHQDGTWVPHVERRVTKAEKWDRLALQLLGHRGGATAEVAADVRNATAEVGVLYGAEFWGSSDPSSSLSNMVDRSQGQVGKDILHVRAPTEAVGVITELGWTATSTKAWRHRMLFWWRLGRSSNKLLHDLEWQASRSELTDHGLSLIHI